MRKCWAAPASLDVNLQPRPFTQTCRLVTRPRTLLAAECAALDLNLVLEHWLLSMALPHTSIHLHSRQTRRRAAPPRALTNNERWCLRDFLSSPTYFTPSLVVHSELHDVITPGPHRCEPATARLQAHQRGLEDPQSAQVPAL